MNVLVTGVDGFAAQHLIVALKKHPANKVFGTSRRHEEKDIFKADMLDASRVRQVIKWTEPDVVYHLASFVSPARSHENPEEAYTTILMSLINIYKACIDLKVRPRIVLVSTGHVYGTGDPALMPFTETAPTAVTSPYVAAKLGAEQIAKEYADKHNFETIIARPFNHTGPRQQLGFIVPDFARQIADLERKADGERTMRVGNLSSERDFTDVRDVVRAYVLLAEKGRPGEIYNVCSETPVSGQEILDILLKRATKEITVEPDPARMQPSDIPVIYGSHEKLSAETGWQPMIPLSQTLLDTLNYWREEIAIENKQ